MTTLPPLPTPWVFNVNHDPPVHTRPLLGSELVVQTLWDTFDGLLESCFGVNFTSSLGIEELRDRARGALEKLRFVCPIISCTVEDVVSPRWVYTPSADREAWLDLAFAVKERGQSLNPSEFVQSINLKRLPYTDGNGTTTFLRLYLLTTSRESDDGNGEYGLYFHALHSIFDAGPALHALNLMCEWISGDGMDVIIEPSEEWKNLPVDPTTATGGPSKEWETAGLRVLRDFAEESARTAPRISVAPPMRQSNRSRPPFRYTVTALESETAAIIAETKKLGVTVTALFHAAFSLAQLKMNPIPEGTEVDYPSDSATVALERYLKPPVNPRTHLISSLTAIPLRFSMGPILMERSEKGRLIMTARILQERFDRYLANPCLPHLAVANNDALVANLGKLRKTEPVGRANTVEPSTTLRWGAHFQNLGVVENRLRTQHRMINVESICSGSRLTHWMLLHMWTMHSKFHFRVQGDAAWNEEYMKMLAEETRRIGLLVLEDS